MSVKGYGKSFLENRLLRLIILDAPVVCFGLNSLFYFQAMAVYGQLTGKPINDPPTPPSGLPGGTPEHTGPSDDGTTSGSVESSIKPKTPVSSTQAFREVEGSKDSQMKWSPPGAAGFRKPGSPTTAHFTAATSPTRSRDFSWFRYLYMKLKKSSVSASF